MLIQKTIEQEYISKKISKSIFKKIKFKLLLLPLALLISLILFQFFKNDTSGIKIIPYFLFFFITPIFYFWIFVNPYIKKELEKKHLKVDNSFFKHWKNDDYMNFEQKLFRNKLIQSKILKKKNSNLNSKLLKEYSDFFKSESENLNDFSFLKNLGKYFLPFIIITFEVITTQFVQIYKSDEEIIAIFKVIFIILLLIYFIFYISYIIKEIIESKKKYFLQISKDLLDLKWSEDLKIKSKKH